MIAHRHEDRAREEWDLVRLSVRTGYPVTVRLRDPIAAALAAEMAAAPDATAEDWIVSAAERASTTDAEVRAAIAAHWVEWGHGDLRPVGEDFRRMHSRLAHEDQVEDLRRRVLAAERGPDRREHARLLLALADAEDAAGAPGPPSLADALAGLTPGEPEGIATGMAWWDDSQPDGIMAPGSMIILAAAPGVGKSALALQVALAALAADPALVAVWAMGEMRAEHLAWRALSCATGLPRLALRREVGELSPLQREAAAKGRARLAEVAPRLRITDRLTPAGILRAVDDAGAGLVVLDYLQLLRPDDGAACDSRRAEVDAVLFALRAGVNARGTVALLISNMAKAGPGKHDAASVSKESSEIGYAADAVYQGVPATDDQSLAEVLVRWRCLKQRHGEPRDIDTLFHRAAQRFRAAGGPPA